MTLGSGEQGAGESRMRSLETGSTMNPSTDSTPLDSHFVDSALSLLSLLREQNRFFFRSATSGTSRINIFEAPVVAALGSHIWKATPTQTPTRGTPTPDFTQKKWGHSPTKDR